LSMGTIIYRKALLTIAELWLLPDALLPPDVDVSAYVHVRDPVPGCYVIRRHTLITTMSDEDEMERAMSGNTRYKVNRAQARDDLRYESAPVRTLEDLAPFLAAYEEHLVASNERLRLDRGRVGGMAKSGLLDVSRIETAAGQVLGHHVHILQPPVARFLYGVSTRSGCDALPSALFGRANRLHHWLDMKRFRDGGFTEYDWGGYYVGDSDAKKMKINEFKRGFGGLVVPSHICLRGATLRGKVALGVLRAARSVFSPGRG
jgi:hypothetical protein